MAIYLGNNKVSPTFNTVIERIITMAFDGWDSISGFDDLAKSIREELDNEY